MGLLGGFLLMSLSSFLYPAKHHFSSPALIIYFLKSEGFLTSQSLEIGPGLNALVLFSL